MRLRFCRIAASFVSVLEHRSGRDCVLLLHGNSSCKESFAKQVDALKRTGLSIVIPDLPGHGQSDNARYPPRDYSFPGYAATFRMMMAGLGYDRYHIVGWSLGGHIGIEMWATDHRACSLLIVGTPPVRLDGPGIAAGFHWTPATSLAGRLDFSSEDAYRYLKAMMGGAIGRHERLASMVARTDGRARRWMVSNAMRGVGLDEALAVSTTDKPLAVMHGRNDPFVRLDYLRSLSYRNIWNAGPILMEAGHAPHWQIPAAFNSELVAFLKSAD